MEPNELRQRTKTLSLRIIKLVSTLPNSSVGRAIASQLVRSGTSIGANYRSAQRGRSKAEFISKLSIAFEEADETCYWLELVIEAELLPKKRVEPLLLETNEVLRILSASKETAKRRNASRS